MIIIYSISGLIVVFIAVIVGVLVHRKYEQDADPVIKEANEIDMKRTQAFGYYGDDDEDKPKFVPKGKSTAFMTERELFGEEEPDLEQPQVMPESPEAPKLSDEEESSDSDTDKSISAV
jgi:hypothetical protein